MVLMVSMASKTGIGWLGVMTQCTSYEQHRHRGSCSRRMNCFGKSWKLRVVANNKGVLEQ